MSWWAWILFWLAFWFVASVYLARRVWLLWPRARAFGRTVHTAWERADEARVQAEEARGHARSPLTRGSADITRVAAVDDLAWNRPASSWRAEWRAARRSRREHRWDAHSSTWARWRRDVD